MLLVPKVKSMIPRSNNGGFQSRNPSFQLGVPSFIRPPGGAQTTITEVDPKVIQPANLNPHWTADGRALDDLFETVLFAARGNDAESLTQQKVRKRKRDNPPGMRGPEASELFYESSTTGERYKHTAVMHHEFIVAGALPHINYLLAKAQTLWSPTDPDGTILVPTSARYVLDNLLSVYPLGVHNTPPVNIEQNMGG